MRGPSSVADSDRPFELFFHQRLLQIDELAHAAPHGNLLSLEHRDSRRIVPSILELGQPSQEDRNRFLIAHISDDSAHGYFLPPFFTFASVRRAEGEIDEGAAWSWPVALE